MSTGYSWEGIKQVRATLLGARHVPEHLCGGRVHLGRYIKWNLSDIIHLPNPQNPLLCAGISEISPAETELLSILSKILLLWQHGSPRGKFKLHH